MNHKTVSQPQATTDTGAFRQGLYVGRGQNYTHYRPDYPPTLYDYLIANGIVRPNAVVADVGAGTGIFTEPLLQRGIHCIAVEPNHDLQQAARITYADFVNQGLFRVVDGSSDQTQLADGCVDVVFAVQAFHWFDPEKFKTECRRILRTDVQRVVLIWNDRDFNFPIRDAIKDLSRKHQIRRDRFANREESLRDFFGTPDYHVAQFKHAHHMDRAGLLGFLASISSLPKAADSGFEAMKNDAEAMFAQFAVNGVLTVPYLTQMYWNFE